jgi:hypothetical protein
VTDLSKHLTGSLQLIQYKPAFSMIFNLGVCNRMAGVQTKLGPIGGLWFAWVRVRSLLGGV